MHLKTLLVCLTTPDNAQTLMRAAVPLARACGAHLIGLHTIEALLVYPGIAMHIPGPAFAEFNKSQHNQAQEIKDVFDRHTRAEDFVSEWRLVRTESASAADRMIESARAADLVLLSQADKQHDRVDQSHIQQRLIRESGRPVIMIPLGYDGPEIGNTVLMGWSGTREATRAAHDVMLVARDKAEIGVLHVGDMETDELTDHPTIELAEMYARHGYAARVIHRERAGKSVMDSLHHDAFEIGADLIATGAFGHSWVYDFVIGAATRDLLAKARLPILFSK
ncbi:universal stress protein [Sulfitobacter sabulilitoris]|nr:universal stress protein [Sulfitobacter sabulilitoris]